MFEEQTSTRRLLLTPSVRVAVATIHTDATMTDMAHEGIPLQYDLFSGELVDNRTPSQKRADQARQQPQQIEMFSQRELAQYVNPHPQMDAPLGTLPLLMQDVRTQAEIECDLLRAAELLTIPLFETLASPPSPLEPILRRHATTLFEVIVERPSTAPLGLRAKLRRNSINVRSRWI